MNKVQVFLSTYNGEKYLREQIESILNQEGINISLLVRDDGSTDSTVSILDEYYRLGKLQYYTGDNVGYEKSFLQLLTKSEEADFYAFADQDDIWDEDKLLTAVKKLNEVEVGGLKLYCSALNLVDENLNYLETKKFDDLKLTIGSAIVRQRIAGCTMVFNKELMKLVAQCYKLSMDIKFGHDGWVYLLCLGSGGTVIFDSMPHIQFRRHGGTITSGGYSFIKRIRNEFKMLKKKRNVKQEVIVRIKNNFQDWITPSNSELLNEIVNYRKSYKNTLKLALNKELRCGIKIIDTINVVTILFRWF